MLVQGGHDELRHSLSREREHNVKILLAFVLVFDFWHEFKFGGFAADTFLTQKIRLLSGIRNAKSGFLFLGVPKTEFGRERRPPEGAIAFLSIRIRLADQP